MRFSMKEFALVTGINCGFVGTNIHIKDKLAIMDLFESIRC